MTFVVCVLFLFVITCYVFFYCCTIKTYKNNNKKGRRLKTKNSIYLNFQCFRYHLCGKLKFDEFPPGVTQVKFVCLILFLFFFGGRGGDCFYEDCYYTCLKLPYCYTVLLFPEFLFRVFQHFSHTTFNTHKHMVQPSIVYFNSYNPSCGGYFMVELFSKSTISVQYDYFDT